MPASISAMTRSMRALIMLLSDGRLCRWRIKRLMTIDAAAPARNADCMKHTLPLMSNPFLPRDMTQYAVHDC